MLTSPRKDRTQSSPEDGHPVNGLARYSRSSSSIQAAKAIDATSRQESLQNAARTARASEKALNDSAQMYAAGAAVAAGKGPIGNKVSALLTFAGFVSEYFAGRAGSKAESFEKQAEAAKQEVAASQEAQSKASQQEQKTKSSTKSPRPEIDKGWDSPGRGNTYGGRASEHNPGRADAISRSC